MTDTLADTEDTNGADDVDDVDDDAQDPAEARPGRRISLRWWVALLAVVLVAAVSAVVAVLVARPSTPGTNSAEAGFARDMQQHHAQAVQMSLIVRDRTTNDEVRLLAYDILTTQQQQQGQMYAWLEMWGLPQARSGPAMAWMAGSDMTGMAAMSPDGLMPGMATSAQLAHLQSLSGTPAEVLYLQLMIAHHKGGVEMAQAVLGLSDQPQVVRLANAMMVSQQSEIDAMENLLSERGATDQITS